MNHFVVELVVFAQFAGEFSALLAIPVKTC